jgi:hypothetical protein
MDGSRSTPAGTIATTSPSGAEASSLIAPTATPSQPAPANGLPPRLDLAYKVYMGTQGFMIGDATYRFEHDAGTYRISTVAQARGLAALIVHGRGKVESRGLITAHGLRPLEFELERGRPDKREVARFDWDDQRVTLHGDKTEPIDALTFDPLTVLWQTYFTPPVDDVYRFSVATTRRVIHYTVTREGEEKIAWPQGELDTVRWHRVSDDNKTEAWFWLAPSMHDIPVKIRVTRTSRGTLEVLLDAIRTDASTQPEAEEPLLPPTSQPVDPFVAHGQ